MGFLVMGFIGFAVKLIHIPINNIIVYVLPLHLCIFACSPAARVRRRGDLKRRRVV